MLLRLGRRRAAPLDGPAHRAHPRRLGLVGAIVQLAQAFNLAVVAEGGEEPGQRAALHEMGCPYGQGYLFARPLSEPDAFALIPKAAPFTAMA